MATQVAPAGVGESKTPPTRRLKVCLASMAPFVGGAEVAAERLALGLVEAGHDVVVLLGQTGEVQARMEKVGLRVVCSPMYLTDKWHFLRYWFARRRLRQFLVKEKPDLLHNNDLPTHQIMSDAARGLGVPRICHHRFPFPGPAIDWLGKYGCERHFFVSKALMDEMCGSSANLAANRDRVVVYDGLPLPPVPVDNDRFAMRRRLGLPTDRVIVNFAGQIIERKGVADLIRAWALLPGETRALAELVIVGDDLAGKGAYRAEMEKLAQASNCLARFVGFQKNVGDWLLAADVATVPSHVEPLGNATLEAMSYALPVIGGDVGGIPEMVVHEQTGLLVPPKSPRELADALGRLIRDGGLRERLGGQGRKRCEELFSLAAHTRAAVAEYGRVLGKAAS